MTPPRWWRRDLRLGMQGNDVSQVQAILGFAATGLFDQLTEAGVRGFQSALGLVPDGEVDLITAHRLGPGATDHMPPSWFGTPREHEVLSKRFGPDDLDAAIRRFQSACRLPPTGQVDERTALLIGE